jgi:hypothetical protein
LQLGAESMSEISRVRQAVEDAFAAWESPVLGFEVNLDTSFDDEITLIALTSDSPVLRDIRKGEEPWQFGCSSLADSSSPRPPASHR